MAKTWLNYPCRFRTKNTVNRRGDSVYTVTHNWVSRYAPINLERGYANPNFGNPSICYIIWASKLHDQIMHTGDDSLITIVGVHLDIIEVNANGFRGIAQRKPQEGLTTFDFVNNNGALSHIHIGHQVYDIK